MREAHVVEAEPQSGGPAAADHPTDGSTSGGAASHRPRLTRSALVDLVTALCSGLLLAAAFAPLAWWPCAPAGVALLSLVLRGRTLRRAAGLGMVAGLSFFLPLVSWAGTYVGPVPWVALATLEGLFFAPMAAAITLLHRGRAWLAPFGVAGVWVAQEALRSRLPWGGFPWGRLAFAMPDAPVGHLASMAGAPGVTAAVALAGGLVAVAAEALLRHRAFAGLLAGAAAGAVLTAPVLVAYPTASGPQITVAVIQGNVPRAGLDFNEQRRAVLDNHVARTRELAAGIRAGTVRRPDLVIWPENSSDVDPLTDVRAAAEINAAVDEVDAPVVVGAVLQSADRTHLLNAGILWLPHRGPVGPFYVKRHPAPFGEYIPLRSVARQFSSAVDRVSQDFAPGTRIGTFSVSTRSGPVTLGDVICFEVAYDSLVRDTVSAGAQLLAVQTNNATFGHTAETDQQLAMTRLRAIETGRWTLSASTSGISAVIGPDGRTRLRSGLFEPAILVHTVELSDRRTPAVSAGGWPELALATVGALVCLAALLRRRRDDDLAPANRRTTKQ